MLQAILRRLAELRIFWMEVRRDVAMAEIRRMREAGIYSMTLLAYAEQVDGLDEQIAVLKANLK